jgi:hypothetical protein
VSWRTRLVDNQNPQGSIPWSRTVKHAQVAELADALDSESSVLRDVGVQFPLCALDNHMQVTLGLLTGVVITQGVTEL